MTLVRTLRVPRYRCADGPSALGPAWRDEGRETRDRTLRAAGGCHAFHREFIAKVKIGQKVCAMAPFRGVALPVPDEPGAGAGDSLSDGM